MMTPEDAKRLVKNRNDRMARAQNAADRAEEAELDFVEEALAIYFSDSDFVEYVTNTADAGMAAAINEGLRFFIAFTRSGNLGEDVSERVCPNKARVGDDVYAVIFDTKATGINFDTDGLSKMLAETVQALYQDAGWNTGYLQAEHYRLYQRYESMHPFRDSVYTYSFEVRY